MFWPVTYKPWSRFAYHFKIRSKVRQLLTICMDSWNCKQHIQKFVHCMSFYRFLISDILLVSRGMHFIIFSTLHLKFSIFCWQYPLCTQALRSSLNIFFSLCRQYWIFLSGQWQLWNNQTTSKSMPGLPLPEVLTNGNAQRRQVFLYISSLFIETLRLSQWLLGQPWRHWRPSAFSAPRVGQAVNTTAFPFQCKIYSYMQRCWT